MSEAKDTSFKAMTTDIEVNMDDVVSAFVAKYEGNLFDRKKVLSQELKAVERDLADLDKAVLEDVTGDEFNITSVEPFDLFAEVDGKTLSWAGEDSVVQFSIAIKAKESGSYYNNKISISRELPVSVKHIDKYENYSSQAKSLRAELAEVLDNIKSISRKERQVRGRIAIRKLEDAGYESLMQDEELVKLVQL